MQRVATDIVEIHVDTVRAGAIESLTQVRGLVAHAGIEPGNVAHPGTLLGCPGNTDRRTAFDPRDLPDKRANSARRRRDDDDVARAGFAEAQQARVRRQPRHTEDAKKCR